MEQTLYLVRHAHAADFQPDSKRPLSAKGKKQIERISSALRGKGLIEPSVIWHSPYLRAIETATLLHEGLGLSVGLETVDGITPFDDPSKIAERIDSSTEDIMVVGHEPKLSSLTSLLLSGSQSFQCMIFPKTSILSLTRLKVSDQSTPWQIAWHISHKHF
tara:strand:- start:14373 stop:14855 length:483 start_codon:yes stop_codon:yes gene_type:complete